MDDNQRFKREVLAVAAALFMGSLYIVYPFLDAVIFAIATSYLLRYTHKWLQRRLDSEMLSSAIIITSVLGLVAAGLYVFITNFRSILTSISSLEGSLESAATKTSEALSLSANFEEQMVGFIGTLSGILRQEMLNLFTQIPSLMIQLGIFTVASIYLYKDGRTIERKVIEIVNGLPEEEKRISHSLIDSLNYIFRGVFVTQFLVAAIIGIIAGIGFYFISLVTSPMPLAPLWAFLIGVTALLPLVANFMIYGPLGSFYLISGEPLKGGLILAFGLVVLQIMPEIFLRPYIGSRQMDEHPLVIFMGFLAGPLVLGLKGLILGPVLLILTKEFILDSSELFS